jgi:hypothetical protein
MARLSAVSRVIRISERKLSQRAERVSSLSGKIGAEITLLREYHIN